MRWISPFFGPILLLLVSCSEDAAGETAESLMDSQTTAPTGSLFYILQEPRRQALMRFNFADGSSQSLFEVPENAWLSHMAAVPDGSQIALAYAPSPGENEIQFGFSSFYLLLADGRSQPRLLLERNVDNEVYFNPTWSPDGQQIYYSHVTPKDDDAFAFAMTLEQVDVTSGEAQAIAEDGIWPRLSPDGHTVAFSSQSGIFLMQPDGSNLQQLLTVSAADSLSWTP